MYKRTFFSLLSLVKGRVFTKHFVETKIGEIKNLFLALRLQPRERRAPSLKFLTILRGDADRKKEKASKNHFPLAFSAFPFSHLGFH